MTSRLLATWGCGHLGRLGHGIHTSLSFPRLVLGALGGLDMHQVACGGAHTAAVAADGTLFSFGSNDMGQLGHSSEDRFIPVPIEVGLPDSVKSVSAGERHTLAVSGSGEVWSFGSNECGQLGTGQDEGGTEKSRHVEPRLVKGLRGVKVVEVVAGASHSLALTADGEIFSWGQSDYGALGHGPEAVRKVEWVPRLIKALHRVKVRSLATGGLFSSGCIDDKGACYTWGNGLYWQLGHGEVSHEYYPRKVQGITRCTSLALGQMHGLATTHGGRLLAWGTDDHGTLGQGEGNWQRVPVHQPTLVSGDFTGAKSVLCGWKHSGTVLGSGKLLTWGWNGAYHTIPGGDKGSGQLGHGDDRDRWAPLQVMRFESPNGKAYDLRMPFLKPWKALQASLGRNHSAMIVEAEVHPGDLKGGA